MSKKTKSIKEIHAKIEGEPTTLDQIWGYNELARYNTITESEYLSQLNEMNRTDLESHARRIGVVIVEGDRLKNKLVSEFRNYVSLLKKPSTSSKNAVDPSDKVRKILAEGR